MTHLVALLVYPGFELLDAAGPASVFGGANELLHRLGKDDFYAIEMVSAEGGLVASNRGISMQTRAFAKLPPSKVNTLLIAGGNEVSVDTAMQSPALARWVPRYASSASRFGSVCTGTFVLAALGLLDGKRVSTHWSRAKTLAESFPSVSVDPNTLYVVDGKVWTSAGVTTGIDMALAMVSQDVGADIAGEVAKQLVLYSRRPGYQSQFSPLLSAQVKADDPFAELIGWVQANLHRPLDVPTLAARVGLSERSFYRKFTSATGQSPAHFIERVRLDAARTLLAQRLPIKTIAVKVGLAPTARFTAAFTRQFGVSPRLFRETHMMPSPTSREAHPAAHH
jgi:transcriptional regulator GlxA family with amidase domain